MPSLNDLRLVPAPKDTLLIVRQDGRIYAADFRDRPQLDDPGLVDWSISVSKLLIGKIQYIRSRETTLEEIELENIVHPGQFPPGSESDMDITVWNSQDGKTPLKTIKPHVSYDVDGFVHAKCRITGKNLSIQLRGTYNINTVAVTFHINGKR